MTETITKDKTLLVLAFAATFLAGAAIFGAISDYEAEAKPKKKCPPDCIIEPILKPMNATLFEILAQMDDLQDDVDAIKSTGNDHGIILGDLQTTVGSIDGKADGIKSVVDTIDAKVP